MTIAFIEQDVRPIRSIPERLLNRAPQAIGCTRALVLHGLDQRRDIPARLLDVPVALGIFRHRNAVQMSHAVADKEFHLLLRCPEILRACIHAGCSFCVMCPWSLRRIRAKGEQARGRQQAHGRGAKAAGVGRKPLGDRQLGLLGLHGNRPHKGRGTPIRTSFPGAGLPRAAGSASSGARGPANKCAPRSPPTPVAAYAPPKSSPGNRPIAWAPGDGSRSRVFSSVQAVWPRGLTLTTRCSPR